MEPVTKFGGFLMLDIARILMRSFCFFGAPRVSTDPRSDRWRQRPV